MTRGCVSEYYRLLRDIPEFVIGVDEVGYGSWAGPLYVGAAVVPTALLQELSGLVRDSKQYSDHKQRCEAWQRVLSLDVGWALAVGSVEEINNSNIALVRQNTGHKAMQLALKLASADFMIVADDGLTAPSFPGRFMSMPKADALCPAVSAASVVAKISRDQHMMELSELFPQYGLGKHMGYGTQQHKDALDRFGPEPKIHRMNHHPMKDY